MGAEAESFEEQRRGYIGGSDWRDILNLPGGCRRRLYYEKIGATEDFPPERPGYFDRGHELEDIVARKAAEKYQLNIVRFPDRSRIGDVPDWWGGNPDRVIQPREECDAVMEAKTKGPYPFRDLKRNGVPMAEVAQCQHYIALSDRAKALYFCLEPVSWEPWDTWLNRDQEMIDKMKVAGGAFWDDVLARREPPRLDPSCSQCKKCPYRLQCQGAQAMIRVASKQDTQATVRVFNDPRLMKLIADRDQLTEVYNEAERLRDENRDAIKEILRQHFGGPIKVLCDLRPVYWISYLKGGLDTKKLKEEYPEAFTACQRPKKPQESLTVY